jgi:glyoxylase-like metal-dependent hydrolase (beta-lactamase superfamily II)
MTKTSSSQPEFRTEFEPRHGEAVDLVDASKLNGVRVRRVVAANSSPYTFTGTNSYLIGDKRLAIIDPGPGESAAPGHLEALHKAIGKAAVTHILITHTHRDHTEHAEELSRLTGARILAFGPHLAARPLAKGETNPLESAVATDLRIDQTIAHSETISGENWSLEAVHTPGHTENHLCFALLVDGQSCGYLFSGDHVMGWNTTIVAPPDGHMGHYFQSLEVLLERPEQTYFPSHGGRIENAHTLVRAIRSHRRIREKSVLREVQSGETDPFAIVDRLYKDIDPKLRGAAALSVLAHLEHLEERGLLP